MDGTRVALRAQVSSLYLMDRDGTSLTLAATNGISATLRELVDEVERVMAA